MKDRTYRFSCTEQQLQDALADWKLEYRQTSYEYAKDEIEGETVHSFLPKGDFSWPRSFFRLNLFAKIKQEEEGCSLQTEFILPFVNRVILTLLVGALVLFQIALFFFVHQSDIVSPLLFIPLFLGILSFVICGVFYGITRNALVKALTEHLQALPKE